MHLLPTIIFGPLKALAGLFAYNYAMDRNWAAFLAVLITGIILDFADGDLARFLRKRFGAKLWKLASDVDGFTDLWQVGPFIGLARVGLISWKLLIAIAIIGGLSGLTVAISRNERVKRDARAIQLFNSLGFMSYTAMLAGRELIQSDLAYIIVLLIDILLFRLTWKGWMEKNIKGTLNA